LGGIEEGKLRLSVLPETLAICQLEKDGSLPDWAWDCSFVSVTRTTEELSIVCPQKNVPAGIRKDGGWKCLMVEGPLDLCSAGILASLTMPLAEAGISVFALSTYDTDYLLVKEEKLEKAVEILKQGGHKISLK